MRSAHLLLACSALALAAPPEPWPPERASMTLPMYNPRLGTPGDTEAQRVCAAKARNPALPITATVCGNYASIQPPCDTAANERAAATMRACGVRIMHYVPCQILPAGTPPICCNSLANVTAMVDAALTGPARAADGIYFDVVVGLGLPERVPYFRDLYSYVQRFNSTTGRSGVPQQQQGFPSSGGGAAGLPGDVDDNADDTVLQRSAGLGSPAGAALPSALPFRPVTYNNAGPAFLEVYASDAFPHAQVMTFESYVQRLPDAGNASRTFAWEKYRKPTFHCVLENTSTVAAMEAAVETAWGMHWGSFFVEEDVQDYWNLPPYFERLADAVAGLSPPPS